MNAEPSATNDLSPADDHAAGAADSWCDPTEHQEANHPPSVADHNGLIPDLRAEAEEETDRPLSVADYTAAERAGRAWLPTSQLMAFTPVTYNTVNFPVRIEDEAELLRYVDHNFEAEVASLYRAGAVFPPVGYVNAFTEDEAKLVERIRGIVGDLTERQFGRRTLPMTNLLVQVGPYRAMEHLASVFDRRPLAVFEAGPGLGYLGALLAMQGHRYASFDVTQSLYLWQNRLLAALAGAEFGELALPDGAAALGTRRVEHLPWWLFSRQIFKTPTPFDIVYSNSNLGEMSLLSLKHLIEFARRSLAESPIAAFMYFSTGMLSQNSAGQIDAELVQFGFKKRFDAPFVCYSLEDRDPDPLTAAFADGIPHYTPSGEPACLTADTLVATPRTQAPLDVPLMQWCYGWDAPLT